VQTAARAPGQAEPERRGLMAVLGAALVLGFYLLAHRQWTLTEPTPVVVAAFAAWSGLAFFLWRHRKSYGREGHYLDLWSIPHFFTGTLVWLLGGGIGWVAMLAVVWEMIELVSRVRERPANRVIDVLLALGGWLLANALLG
jgi:hypothetical protein